MSLTNKDLTKIGLIANTFGKQGEVKLLITSNYFFNNEVDPIGKILFFRDEMKILQPLRIKNVRQVQDNLLLVQFEGINSITQAERLKNKFIHTITNDNLFGQKPDYTEFRVIWKDQDWAVLEAMENPNNALVKIKVAGQRVWIPLVDEYLDKIDFEKKLIYVKNFERLF